MTIYTHKLVDGVVIPLTPEEIEELEQRDVEFAENPPPMPGLP